MSDCAPFMHEPPKAGKAAGRFSSCMPMLHAAARSAMNKDRFLEQHSSSSSDGKRVSLSATLSPHFLGDKWCSMEQPRSRRAKKETTVAESQQHMTYFNGVFSANSDGTGGLVVQVLEHIGSDSEICIRTNPICIDAGEYLLAACLHDALQRILICRADCRRVNFAVVPGEMQILPGVWMTTDPKEGLFLAALQYEPGDSPRSKAGLDLPKRLFGSTTAEGDVIVAWKNGKCPTRAMDRYTSTIEGFEMGFFDDEELVVVLWREGRGIKASASTPCASVPQACQSTYSMAHANASVTMASSALSVLASMKHAPFSSQAGSHSDWASARSSGAGTANRGLPLSGRGRGRGRKRRRSPMTGAFAAEVGAVHPSHKLAASSASPSRGVFASPPRTTSPGSNTTADTAVSHSKMNAAAETVRATAARILASMAGSA